MPQTYKKIMLLTGIFALAICVLSAQGPRFHNINIRNELFANAVISITGDRQGFIWLGTPEGLNRYDGHSFKLYKSLENDSTSLCGNYILSLYTDTRGRLWVGSDMGLQYFDPLTDGFVTVHDPAVYHRHIITITEDPRGQLWVGTDQGLVGLREHAGRYRSQTYHFKQLTHNAKDEVNSIYVSPKGTLWVGLNSGIARGELEGDRYRFRLFEGEPGGDNNLRQHYITSVTGDRRGGLWFGTADQGLYYYNTATGASFHYHQTASRPFLLASNNVRKLLCDSRGDIWVSTQNGLTRIGPDRPAPVIFRHDPGQSQSLSQNSVYALYEDRQHSLWAGTYFGGVNVLYAVHTPFHRFQSDHLLPGLSHNIISSIQEDRRHNLWIGTQGGDGGLDYYNPRTGEVTNFKHDPQDSTSLSSNLVEVLYLAADGYLLIGTHGGGLNILAPGSNKFKKYLYSPDNPEDYNEGIIAILEDSRGRTWLAHNTGIQLYHRWGASMQRITGPFAAKVAGIVANCLAEDSLRQIWIGSPKGLFVCKDGRVSATAVKQPVNCIQAGPDGRLYLGTSNQGLGIYTPQTGDLRYMTTKQGLPGNNIIGILVDKHHTLWLSTDYGLVRYRPGDPSIKTYTTVDGLSDNRFNRNAFFKDHQGLFYFGGLNGLTYFYPDSIAVNSVPSPLAFTDLSITGPKGRPVQLSAANYQQLISAGRISLPYDHNSFTTEFALLNYIKSSKNTYRYQLGGYDRQPITTHDNFAAYTNVPPGDYTLIVQAANNDGIWSEPVRLAIHVSPPLWKTWWAYLVYVLAVLAVLFFIIQYFFLRAVLRKEDALHQNKLNFFTNISHEIRTHLSLIKLPMDKIMENEQADEIVKFQLEGIKSKFYRLLRLATELMDFQKADTQHLRLQRREQDFIGFLQEIFDNFQQLALNKDIQTRFTHTTDTLLFCFDSVQLEKAFFNLLSNAFKFTEPRGHIEVAIHTKKSNTGFNVQITDSGRGIPARYKDKIFTNYFQVEEDNMYNTGYGIGLALAKSIIELHGGRITVESKTADARNPHSYTRFIITFRPDATAPRATRQTTPADHPLEARRSGKTQTDAQTTALPPAPRFQNPETAMGLDDNTVLLVEDNAELRNMIKDELTPHFTVSEAENGQSGWEIITSQIPDLIITDIMMPVLDGISLTQRIKRDQRTSHIPVMMLTAKSAQSDQENGLGSGADVYISKPFSAKALLMNVRNLLLLRDRSRSLLRQQLLALQTNPAQAPESLQGAAKEQDFLARFIQHIEDNLDSPELNTEALARAMAMSRPVLYKKIKALTDMSIHDFVKMMKLKKAALLLKENKLSVKEICFAVGYSDRRYFTRAFKKYYGVSPTEYSSGQQKPPQA